MKAIKYFTCIVLLAVTSRIYSQIPDTIWTKTFGGSLADVGNSVKQTNDGGFIVAGTTSSFGAGGQDIWLIKTDENGDTLWTKTFGGAGNDRASNVVQTNDFGYAIFGTTNSYGNGGDDFLLWKVDATGNTQWFKTHGTSYKEYMNEGQQSSDGGFILGGYYERPDRKGWIVKTDSSGNEEWNKMAGVPICGLCSFSGNSVQQTPDGGYLIGGTWGYYYLNGYRYDWFIQKFSSDGDSLFYKTYTYVGGDFLKSIRNTADGNLILAGVTMNQVPWLLKLNHNGSIIWSNILTISHPVVSVSAIEPLADNGFIISFTTQFSPKKAGLLRTNSSGYLSWELMFGGSSTNETRSVSPTNDEGYIVTGQTNSIGAGDFDVWLLKFEYNPPDVQINFFPPIDTAWIFGGCTGPDLISHNLVSTPVRDSITIEPGGNSNFFYYDSLGNVVPVDKYYFIVTDSLNQFDYEVWFHPKSWPPFDPILIPFDSVFYFQQYSFDIQLVVNLNGVPIDSLSQFFRAEWGLNVEDKGEIPIAFALNQNYPNPFNPVTKIGFTISDFGFVSLKVYDILGNEIATLVSEEKQPGNYEVEFNIDSHSGLPSGEVRNLSSGIYFYQLRAGDFVETKKMVLLK